jgi:hypothetical protein
MGIRYFVADLMVDLRGNYVLWAMGIMKYVWRSTRQRWFLGKIGLVGLPRDHYTPHR